jgi:hypothetical protein
MQRIVTDVKHCIVTDVKHCIVTDVKHCIVTDAQLCIVTDVKHSPVKSIFSLGFATDILNGQKGREGV